MKKLLLILLALTVAVGAFAGPSSETAKPAAKEIKNPDTFTYSAFGDADSLDPAKAYDNASGGIIQNIYETLIFYKGSSTSEFVPVLATEVPTVANGGISKDGLTFTFKIRTGVKFHSGNPLTPEDVRYSFLRAMVTDPDGGPAGLLLNPLVGVGITRDGDGNVNVKFADIAKSVTVSGDTVSFHLVSNHPAFLAVLAGYWSATVDKKFCIANGDWDGTEATWKQFNNPATGSEKLAIIASGTGPFKLDRWEKGSEIVMLRNDNYWGKKPAMAKAIYKIVEEWSTRKLLLLQGDVDSVEVNPGDYAELDTESNLTVYRDNPELGYRAINFNQKINAQDNPYIYSGKLDGQGIPPDFFADKNIRLAFNHAWDEKTYLDVITAGHSKDAYTPVVDGLPYFDANTLKQRPAYDVKKAEEYFKKAFGGQVWEKGFKLDVTYNTGNTAREQALKFVAESVMKINPKFQIEVRGVEWATFLEAQRNNRLTMFYIGWGADYPDPDNFVDPYMNSVSGTYALYCSYVNAEADKLIAEGRKELDPAKRKAIYYRLQQIWVEDAVGIGVAQPIVNRYFRDWVKGYVYHPMENQYTYAMFEKKY